MSKGTESILGGWEGVDVGEKPLQMRVLTTLGKADRLEVGWGGRVRSLEIDHEENGMLTLQSSPKHKVRGTDLMANQESSISQTVIELVQSGDNLRMSSCLCKRPGC